MNRATPRAIALVGAVCLLGVVVLAATAQAALVTPHAASSQLVTPQASAPAPAAPDPGAPAVEGQAEEEPTTVNAPASTTTQPAPGTRAQSTSLPVGDKPKSGPSSGPDPIERGVKVVERAVMWLICLPDQAHYNRAFQSQAYQLGLTFRAELGILTGFESTNQELATARADFQNAIEQLQTAQAMVQRNCFNTRTP